MGKSKVKKAKQRPSPAGIITVKCTEVELDNCKMPTGIESSLSSLLDQLQVPDSEENLCGLRRLAEMFFTEDKTILDDPTHSVSRDLQQRFIRSVAPFLVDSRSDIRNAAAGALRNVSIAGGLDMCEIMVSDDVVTPLVALLQKYATDDSMIIQHKNTEEQTPIEKEKLDTLLQAIHLLLNLCESSETAVKYFNSNNLLAVLLRFMDVSVGGVDLAVSVAQCLHTVSDDNSTVLSGLQNSEEELVKLIMIENSEPSYLHLRTLAAGLLVNIHGGVPVKYLNYIFNIFYKVIEIDSQNELCNLSSETPLEKEDVLSSDAVIKLEKLLIIIEAQITMFEILTNICSGEEDDMMDFESLNDSDDEIDIELNNSKDCIDVSVSHPLTISSHVHEALVKFNLLQHSYNKTKLPLNVADILNNHTDTKNILKKFQRLRSRAFHFINNLTSVLEPDDLGSPDNLFKMWSEIGHVIVNGDNDVEVIEASTNALRAILTKLVSMQYPGLSQMTQSDLEVLFRIVQNCKDNNVCANVTQVIGALGVFCANKNLNFLLKDIGRFIIAIAERQGPLWLIAEALDTLMDVFAEDNTDNVAQEIALVSHLSAIAPVFKKKVRAERKTLGDHYALVTTANSNLTRFISYKKNRPNCIQISNGK
ncbi:HEAT repeat-containing protein 3 [Lycorma delicatula]|uniref:HEAT repeat-containing protein 3 n=1 Tax=Lycorma delicatula TaxID=130591 RepID=UPI003F51645A